MLASSYRSKLGVCVVWAQTSNPQIASSQARIAQDLELIRAAEQQHIPAAQPGALWDSTRGGLPRRNRIPEGGGCVQQVAASAEDCAISQRRVCLNTRQPGFALPDLRPFGRRRERQKASSHGAPEVGRPDRYCGQRNTPGGHSSRSAPVQEGGATSPTRT